MPTPAQPVVCRWPVDRLLLAMAVGTCLVMFLGLPVARQLGFADHLHCPMKMLLGIPCPTCGFTRVCELLGRGQVMEAMGFQPFVVGLFLFVPALTGIMLWRGVHSLAARRLAQFITLGLMLSWVWNLWHHL